MSKKYEIQVRKYEPGQSEYGSKAMGDITGDYGKFEVVETINRVVKAEPFGNFNPIFCRYKKKKCWIHSDAGDTSDPFRRTDEYVKTFFITV